MLQMLLRREVSPRFNVKEHATALSSSENGSKHTRATVAHFGVREQAKALNSLEKCRWHTMV
jgi:hypothetical protein